MNRKLTRGEELQIEADIRAKKIAEEFDKAFRETIKQRMKEESISFQLKKFFAKIFRR